MTNLAIVIIFIVVIVLMIPAVIVGVIANGIDRWIKERKGDWND